MRATVATDVRPPIWLSLAVAAACLVALADWPYGFYQFLRLVVTGYAVWIAFQSAAQSRPVWPWVFGVVAVLYNPLFKISMSRDAHAIENVCTAIAIVLEAIRAKRGNATSSR